MGDKEIQIYKPAKKTAEQVEYLQENKRVKFNIINKEEAAKLLLKYNYINVITPFKHYFALIDEKKQVVKIDGRHVYENDVEFNEYYNLFKEERNVYPIIIKNILEFEIHFKSITSYHILTNCAIQTSDDLKVFLNELIPNFNFSGGYSAKRVGHMKNQIDNLVTNTSKYADVYCFFDQMTLGTMLTVYSGLPNNLQKEIFSDLHKNNMVFNVSGPTQFIDIVFRLVSIRNCVMHGNSLTILKRFFNPKTHELRNQKERIKYEKLIKKLEKEKQPD